MGKDNRMVFIPTKEEKERAERYCNELISELSGESVELKAYVIQILLNSFEESFNIDIRNSIAISQDGER